MTSLIYKSGVDIKDQRLLRLFSVATQKFVSEIVVDAIAQQKLKSGNPNAESKPKLTTDDLLETLKDHGYNLAKPPYFT